MTQEPCKLHLFALCQTGQRKYVACLLCGALKPAEPCYFSEAGERARALLTTIHNTTGN